MAKFSFGGGKSDEDDEINRKAHREVVEAQERRASEKQTERELSQNPDSAQSMEKHFSGQADKEREAKVNDDAANERFKQALAAQQKGISDVAKMKQGGFTKDYATKTNIEDGAAGIVARGGRNYTPTLKIGASVEEMKAVADMSNAMQRHRRLIKEYERREREKKKNDGGLAAARQAHKGKSYFPGRPLFKVGSVTYAPMDFKDGMPITNLYRSCESGWCAHGSDVTDTLQRVTLQAGRKYLQTFTTGI